jgi:hypothetical protein
MSRFRDLWVSGKYAIDRKAKDEVDVRTDKEAAQMMHQLIPDASQQIYRDLSTRRGQETGKWLKSLAGDAPAAAESWVQAQAAATDSFEEARVWIDALFQEFGSLTYGFNDTVVGTDLLVNCEKAQVVETRDDDVWYHPVTKTIQGRLTTRFWCLFVRGSEEKISIYIFPAEMTIGFKAGHYTDEDSPPFLVAEHKSVDGRNSWNIQGEEASLATVPPLAKELFGDLIRMASGKMSESELFVSHTEQPKLGENVAVGFQQAAQSAVVQPEQLTIELDEISMHDACDVVDKVIDKELSKLYQAAAKLPPGSPKASQARRQISAVETFRAKIVDAFENFTKESHTIAAEEPSAVAAKS